MCSCINEYVNAVRLEHIRIRTNLVWLAWFRLLLLLVIFVSIFNDHVIHNSDWQLSNQLYFSLFLGDFVIFLLFEWEPTVIVHGNVHIFLSECLRLIIIQNIKHGHWMCPINYAINQWICACTVYTTINIRQAFGWHLWYCRVIYNFINYNIVE